jgi:hypothetical protein
MPDAETAQDDRLTLISVSALAYILSDVLHEGLGHGVVAWLSGAQTMSTVALQSDTSIDAGVIFFALLVIGYSGAPLWQAMLGHKKK